MRFSKWLLEKKKDDADDFLKKYRKLSPDAGSKKKRVYGSGGIIDPSNPGLRKPFQTKYREKK